MDLSIYRKQILKPSGENYEREITKYIGGTDNIINII